MLTIREHHANVIPASIWQLSTGFTGKTATFHAQESIA